MQSIDCHVNSRQTKRIDDLERAQGFYSNNESIHREQFINENGLSFFIKIEATVNHPRQQQLFARLCLLLSSLTDTTLFFLVFAPTQAMTCSRSTLLKRQHAS